MKGILLAGGSGSRLSPMSDATSKHLLPVFNKPMVYYPLSTLLLAGATEILLVTTKEDQSRYVQLLGDGSQFGCRITYESQASPKGIVDGLLLGEEFVGGSSFTLVLGDNIFYGTGVGSAIADFLELNDGATIFTQRVASPELYGVLEVDSDGLPRKLIEKPEEYHGNMAVTGLYIFDNSAFEKAKSMRFSSRGELEVTDLLQEYISEGSLTNRPLPRGTAWLDCGTVKSLSQAGEFVRVTEERQGFMISCPEEIAWRKGLISAAELRMSAARVRNQDYSRYLLGLLESSTGKL